MVFKFYICIITFLSQFIHSLPVFRAYTAFLISEHLVHYARTDKLLHVVLAGILGAKVRTDGLSLYGNLHLFILNSWPQGSIKLMSFSTSSCRWPSPSIKKDYRYIIFS